MRCIFGHAWGPLEKGYQCCKHCGRLKSVACSHRWGHVEPLATMSSEGKVDPDGYQYCDWCGEARKIPCRHSWVEVAAWTRSNRADGKLLGETYRYHCKLCGEFKLEVTNFKTLYKD